MPLSSRYPQLLRVLAGFSPVTMRGAPQNRRTPPELRRSRRGVRVNEVRTPVPFCTDPEQANPPTPSSSIQNHRVECCAAVRVR
jgi:hypothetical protein